jgi:hypothetical protein
VKIASADKDVPLPPPFAKDRHFSRVEVDDREAVKAAPAGMDIYLPERTTFYGSREIGVKDPAGHFITFAHFRKVPLAGGGQPAAASPVPSCQQGVRTTLSGGAD